MKIVVAVTCLALIAPGAVVAQPSDVPPDHWAYEAVRDLAEKGLVLGYPDGSFLGDRTLTRYEMATIIKRVIDQVGQPAPETPRPASGPVPAPRPSEKPTSTPDDLQAIRKLVEEFKVELTVIGTDLASFKERVDKLEQELGALKEAVSDPKGSMQTTISDVSKLKKIKLSGYVQARYEYDQSAADGTSKNQFNVRRARLKATAKPTNSTAAVVEIDAAGSSEENSVTTKEVFVQHYFGDGPETSGTITFGQYKWPFGHQLVQSAALRDALEPARVIRTLFPGEYDRGAKYTTANKDRLFWETGLFNGTGVNKGDNNHEKDLVGRARYAVNENLDAGMSWYFGEQFVPASGTTPAAEFDKTRYGADFQLRLRDATLKAEYIAGRDLGHQKWGYYALVAYDLTPRNTAVLMYDAFNDPADPKGRLSSWNVGWTHWPDTATRLRLFYEFNGEEHGEVDNDLLRLEMVSLY